MTQRKHTACSHCTWLRKTRYLELMWREACSGPWHYVAGWWCTPCRSGFIGFIEGLDAQHQLVTDEQPPVTWPTLGTRRTGAPLEPEPRGDLEGARAPAPPWTEHELGVSTRPARRRGGPWR